VDTSVWGGYYEKEFSEWMIPFIEQARHGLFTIVLSDITIGELQEAPMNVRTLPESTPAKFIELISITDEQLFLADNYVIEGALTPKYLSDAQHIAISSIIKVDSLVSWNFKYMVNFFRIQQYNSINLKFGFQTIDTKTPKEVTYETENE